MRVETLEIGKHLVDVFDHLAVVNTGGRLLFLSHRCNVFVLLAKVFQLLLVELVWWCAGWPKVGMQTLPAPRRFDDQDGSFEQFLSVNPKGELGADLGTPCLGPESGGQLARFFFGR